MTGGDLVLQFLGMAVNPLVLAAGLLGTLRLSRGWQVRTATAALAAVLGGVEGTALGGLAPAAAYAAVSGAAGLLVAEIVLHIVPPVILLALRIAAATQAWLRRSKS